MDAETAPAIEVSVKDDENVTHTYHVTVSDSAGPCRPDSRSTALWFALTAAILLVAYVEKTRRRS